MVGRYTYCTLYVFQKSKAAFVNNEVVRLLSRIIARIDIDLRRVNGLFLLECNDGSRVTRRLNMDITCRLQQ